MSTQIKTVGVIGTGVIGASWTTLFLAKGLKVIVSDPAPEAGNKLRNFIKHAWPSQEAIGLAAGADPNNLRFVSSVADHLEEVQFVQEVGPTIPLPKTSVSIR